MLRDLGFGHDLVIVRQPVFNDCIIGMIVLLGWDIIAGPATPQQPEAQPSYGNMAYFSKEGTMPTRPPAGLFDPDLAKAQVRPVIDIATPLLTEVVAHGLALFARCSIRPEGYDENLAILLVYRHILEMLDSVKIQIAECAATPAALQLRSVFEALLTLEYMTEDKGKTKARAHAYLHEVQLQRKHFYASQDASTAEGKHLRELMSGDPYYERWKPVELSEITERLKNIDTVLDLPSFREVAEEYARTKKARKRNPDWYGLYDGPRNIEGLAKHLKRGASYALLYKEWSERIHGGDAIDRILTHDSSGPAARSLRDASELNSSIDFAITFGIDAARCLIRYYRPAEEQAFAKWVMTEIMPDWKRIPKIEVNPPRPPFRPPQL
jgi:hypothetical protein